MPISATAEREDEKERKMESDNKSIQMKDFILKQNVS